MLIVLTRADPSVERGTPVRGGASVTVRAHGPGPARLDTTGRRVAHRVAVTLTRRTRREVPSSGERTDITHAEVGGY